MNSLQNFFQSDFDFIQSGYLVGQENMNLDTERVQAVANGSANPMLRIYGWKPWAVSLGYNQKETDIDRAACESNGFDIVRRPTGGRAVLHSNELTYCVVANLPAGTNMHDAYKAIHIFLVESIEQLDINTLSFQKSKPDLREFYNRSAMSASCFASTAQYEIEFNGRKVVGSAQRLTSKTLLQHGSVLLAAGHERLADVINLKTVDEKQRLKKFMLDKSATLQDAAGRPVSYEELSRSISKLMSVTA